MNRNSKTKESSRGYFWIDGTYDMVAVQEVAKYGRKSGVDFGPIDYVKYAEAFGAVGLMIRTADEIAPVLKKAFDTPGPVLVGIHTDSNIRQLLEPGPVVLVSSAWKGKNNIMTMGWHTVIEFSPSLVGCVIADDNVSFEMIRECVLNVATADLVDKVVGIGNCSGDAVDKFERFRLTPVSGVKVAAPLIRECFANLECRIAECASGEG